MRKILFVCLGNICRSPAAHAIMQAKVDAANKSEEFYIDSAGTANYHTGELPDKRMREHGINRGYQLNSRAQQLKKAHGEEFDEIYVMDHSNLHNAKKILDKKHHHKINLLLNLTQPSNYEEVPDPYYEGPEGFELVLDLLENACTKVLNR